jgi:hypothetical protein
MSKLFWIMVIFLLIGGYLIKVAYDYDFGRGEDREGFLVRFGRWIGHLGQNVIGLVGYASQQQWLPLTNGTNTTR